MLRKLMLSVCRAQRVHKLLRSQAAINCDQTSSDVDDNVHAETLTKRRVRAILCQIDTTALKTLSDCLESGGQVLGGCIHLPCISAEVCHCLSSVRHMCRYFRWPYLPKDEQLVCLPMCSQSSISTGEKNVSHSICVNPFHWSRIHRPKFCSAEKITEACLDRCRFYRPSVDSANNTTLSSPLPVSCRQNADDNTVDLSGINCEDDDDVWCRLFYFEGRCLVGGGGGGWCVRSRWQHVFYNLTSMSGLSLACAASSWSRSHHGGQCRCKTGVSVPEPDNSVRERCIGSGFTVWLDKDGVYLYNRHERPLFVSSCAIGCHGNSPGVVERVQSGHSMLVFRASLVSAHKPQSSPPVNSPRHCVTLSFAKGWGDHYQRSSVLECTCWMELWMCGPALLTS